MIINKAFAAFKAQWLDAPWTAEWWCLIGWKETSLNKLGEIDQLDPTGR
jgi:hypothetical protein